MKVSQNLPGTSGGAPMKASAGFSQQIGSPNYQRMLETAISDPKHRMRFTSSLIAAVSATPALKNCTTDSIITAALQFVPFDFAIGTGAAWIIPYGERATFQIGAKGYRQLAMRSGMYKDLDTIEVREGEFLGRDEFTGKPKFRFIEDDDEREKRPIIGYLAYFELLNGFKANVYFSKEKMMEHAHRYSQAFDKETYKKYEAYQQTGEGMTQSELKACSSPWYGDFNGMAEKTCLKRLLSQKGLLSTELVNAFTAENDQPLDTNAGMFEAPIPSEIKTPEKEQVIPVDPQTGEVVSQQKDSDDFFFDE